MFSLQAGYQLLRMAFYIRREKVDVVHAHDLWGNLMGVPAAWLARAPVIISSQRDLATLWWYTPQRRRDHSARTSVGNIRHGQLRSEPKTADPRISDSVDEGTRPV